jgi:hypothetical protein
LLLSLSLATGAAVARAAGDGSWPVMAVPVAGSKTPAAALDREGMRAPARPGARQALPGQRASRSARRSTTRPAVRVPRHPPPAPSTAAASNQAAGAPSTPSGAFASLLPPAGAPLRLGAGLWGPPSMAFAAPFAAPFARPTPVQAPASPGTPAPGPGAEAAGRVLQLATNDPAPADWTLRVQGWQDPAQAPQHGRRPRLSDAPGPFGARDPLHGLDPQPSGRWLPQISVGVLLRF